MESEMFCWTIDLNASGQLFIPRHSGDTRLLQKYSQFKFGNTQEVEYFSEALYQHLKLALNDKNSILFNLFEKATLNRTHIYFTAPGIRNVPSASNLLLNLTAMKLNRYLARRGLLTGIVRPITRLASGRANYATLPQSQRENRKKTTQSLIPISDYAAHPIHVIFFDDLIASGATVERARNATLKAGALSFTSCSLFKSTPKAAEHPQFEHDLNSYEITGVLDACVVACLSTKGYVPVQRMLRLLLHPSNTEELVPFVEKYVSLDVLIKMCSLALANNYLTIVPQGNGKGLYAQSLSSLITYVDRKNPKALS